MKIKKINKGHVISLESTVYPGFTELLTSKLSRKKFDSWKRLFCNTLSRK